VQTADSAAKINKVNNVPLNTVWVILETIFPANLLTGVKPHSAFSTNHFADANITTRKNNANNLNNHAIEL